MPLRRKQRHRPPPPQQEQHALPAASVPLAAIPSARPVAPPGFSIVSWMGTSPVWCALADRAQEVLHGMGRPATRAVLGQVAAAYVAAFGGKGAASTAEEELWLCRYLGAGGATSGSEEEYGGSSQDCSRAEAVGAPAALPNAIAAAAAAPAPGCGRQSGRANKGRPPLPFWVAVPSQQQPQLQLGSNQTRGLGMARRGSGS